MSPQPSLVPDVTALPPTGPVRLDGFQQALDHAATPHAAAPLGEAVLQALHGFQSRSAGMQALVARISAPESAPPQPGLAGSAAAPEGTPDAMLQRARRLQSEMVGVMLQTYDFAIEAATVSRAATTFTSSVNTLIKTQ